MCTVTFIPFESNTFILTSNRDEAPGRETLPPEKYKVDNVELLFPKDKVAGGSWIGVSEKKRLICLLNGGFTAHERAESYRMSRGIIVTEFLTSNDVEASIKKFDFKGIEPFTIILVQWQRHLQLHELVWDGNKAHFTEKSLIPHIWSSSLLYSQAMKDKRENWFESFLKKTKKPSEKELLMFHKTAGDTNLESRLVMDRGFVKTKSITQVVYNDNNELKMRYEDLQQNTITQNTF